MSVYMLSFFLIRCGKHSVFHLLPISYFGRWLLSGWGSPLLFLVAESGFYFFYHEWILNIVKSFFCINWRIIWVFFFFSLLIWLNWLICKYWTRLTLFRTNPTWSCRIILLVYSWIWFANILLKKIFFYLYVRNSVV